MTNPAITPSAETWPDCPSALRAPAAAPQPRSGCDKGPTHKESSPVCQIRETAQECFKHDERSRCPVENPRAVEQGPPY